MQNNKNRIFLKKKNLTDHKDQWLCSQWHADSMIPMDKLKQKTNMKLKSFNKINIWYPHKLIDNKNSHAENVEITHATCM